MCVRVLCRWCVLFYESGGLYVAPGETPLFVDVVWGVDSRGSACRFFSWGSCESTQRCSRAGESRLKTIQGGEAGMLVPLEAYPISGQSECLKSDGYVRMGYRLESSRRPDDKFPCCKGLELYGGNYLDEAPS